MRLLLSFSLLNIPISSLQLNINNQIPKIINKLKTNNDNVFEKSPDLNILSKDFALTINDTLILNKTKYESLYKKVRGCQKYISKDVMVNNTFVFLQDNPYIYSKTDCKFNLKFIPKSMKITMYSKYFFNNYSQIIQHDIENININNKQKNILKIILEYVNKTKNKSVVGFFKHLFIKK
tara:strand:+ start:9266 stop:9802 length:537 start_codon:yes stop_codon:yes gene_type:complete